MNNNIHEGNLEIAQNAVDAFRKLTVVYQKFEENICKNRPLNAQLDWSKPAQHLISTENNCCMFCGGKINNSNG